MLRTKSEIEKVKSWSRCRHRSSPTLTRSQSAAHGELSIAVHVGITHYTMKEIPIGPDWEVCYPMLSADGRLSGRFPPV